MTIVNFTPLSALAGGVLIGVSAVVLLAASSRIAGITGFVRRVLAPTAANKPLEAAAFLGGIMAAPVLWRALTGADVVQTVSANSALMVAAGLLVGFGSALGNGCTSGHGVCGLARLSPRSIAATLTFMIVAGGTVYVLRHVLGAA